MLHYNLVQLDGEVRVLVGLSVDGEVRVLVGLSVDGEDRVLVDLSVDGEVGVLWQYGCHHNTWLGYACHLTTNRECLHLPPPVTGYQCGPTLTWFVVVIIVL